MITRKKKLLTAILAAIMVLGLSVPTFADGVILESVDEYQERIPDDVFIEDDINDAEDNSEIEVTDLELVGIFEEDPYSVLYTGLENICPNNYAGIYFGTDDNKYHIVAVDVDALKIIINGNTDLNSAYSEIQDTIVFKSADYSIEELEAARWAVIDVLNNDFDNLYTAIDYMQNAVVIEAKNITNSNIESKTISAASKAVAATESDSMMARNSQSVFDNIVFAESDSVYEETAGVPLGSQLKFAGWAYSFGVGVQWTQNGATQYGYMSAGHHWSQSDGRIPDGTTVTYNGATTARTLKSVNDSRNLDYSLSPRSTTSYYPVRYTINNTAIDSAGSPVMNEPIYIYAKDPDGQNRILNVSSLVATNATIPMKDGRTLTNRIHYRIPTVKGNSGGAVIAVRNGKRVFIGITVTNDTGSNNSAGCRWDYIKSNNTNMNIAGSAS